MIGAMRVWRPVRIVVTHPEYEADVTLTDDQRDEIVGDFAA